MAEKMEENLSPRREINKGAWTAEEDRKLAEVIAVHGPKRWKSIAIKAAREEVKEENTSVRSSEVEEDSNISFDVDQFFDFSNEDPLNLEWMSRFLEVD
ncbi:hypothetical protein COLO4_30760 [Corchorus olitorius]|uniref:Uncharacterized protein n=1 Tax=Corchorus olitorius TaxID=93759 RepID=A0A1R3H791_9ROSI|nr:hypothetical protein COLO4_30760 [Corchorus olitorius]